MSKDNSKVNSKNKKTFLKLKITVLIITLFFLLGFALYSFINQNSEYNLTQENNQTYKEKENYKEYKYNQDFKENVVIRVIDGDTFELANHDIVRLICVDTPEKGKKGYEEAKEFLEELVLFKEVYLEKSFDDKDKYGRFLRYVYVNDITSSNTTSLFINKEIIDNNYGKIFPYGNNTISNCEELLK
jgi:preprotein translocase subunit SecG